jgi:hypothetical protein
MRAMLVFMLFLLPALSLDADAAVTAVSDRCAERAPTYDSHEVACRFDVSIQPRRYRLQANFSGGHDDTMARLTVTLNAAELTCDAGSKTRLMGEDGDVSLLCMLTLPARSDASELVATFFWSHAQYVGYSVSEMPD